MGTPTFLVQTAGIICIRIKIIWIKSEFHHADCTVNSTVCRVGIYYQLVRYMKEHFGDDAKGRKKAFYFLPWHFNFFCRYRYCPKLSSLLAYVRLWLSMIQAVHQAL